MKEENYLKTQRIYKTIMLMIVCIFITFLITSITMYTYFENEGNPTTITLSDSAKNVGKAIERYRKIIDTYYLGDIDEDALIEGAIAGYVEALGDEYTEYISKDTLESYTEDVLGNFVGIGIYMVKNTEEDKVQVLTPIQDSPAQKAGILPGDLISKVDGINYTAEDFSDISNVIKGEEGTNVNIEIIRDGEVLTFDIKRERINTNPITAEVLENNMGYISITSFDEDTAARFKEKYDTIESQGITSLIIDLRNNGGGIVDEAIKIADFITDKDTDLLITVNKDKKEEITKSKEDPIINMPIVVLVNGNTASASEILTGALKDSEKAKIVGTVTYGKGVIQEFLTLIDGSGIKITSEEYYTPNRTKINGVGIIPDEIVQLPETVKNAIVLDENQDTQLQKAIELLK